MNQNAPGLQRTKEVLDANKIFQMLYSLILDCVCFKAEFCIVVV